ncbi:MAG: YibE/F family protein [Actinomycetota bacterium]
MGAGHSHGADASDDAVDERVRRLLWIAVVAIGAVVLVGLVVLRTGGSDAATIDPLGFEADPIRARVVASVEVPCDFDPVLPCTQLTIVPDEGAFAGERLDWQIDPSTPIDDGDDVLVLIDQGVDGTLLISFFDFPRSTSMLLLVLLFVVAILVLGGWRGLGAIAGLAASLVVIVGFTLPAVLDGRSSVLVALVSASVIAYLALFLAHGPTAATATALLSSLASLAITGGLAWLFVVSSSLTGLADESVGFLDALGSEIDPRGLLLAGIIIGSLGVLDDVTVTQVSAVWELHRGDPAQTWRQLYARGLRIGRDHISSTVNTLFLAYAGAAMPLLLLFREAGQSVGSVLTREVVATEVIRALVGSIGLIASVPISTLLAARVVTAQPSPTAFTEPAARAEHTGHGEHAVTDPDRLPPPRPAPPESST